MLSALALSRPMSVIMIRLPGKRCGPGVLVGQIHALNGMAGPAIFIKGFTTQKRSCEFVVLLPDDLHLIPLSANLRPKGPEVGHASVLMG